MTKQNQLTVQLIVISCTVLVCVSAKSCSRDEDCGKPNTYCYDTGFCANCTDCKLYSRKPGGECAKHKDQCGDCLPGLEADTNTDGTLSICRPIITTEPPDVNKDEGNNITGIIIAIVVVVIIIGACAGLLIRCYIRNNCPTWKITVHRFRSMCPNCLMKPDDRPPPYTVRQHPTAPPFEEPAAPDPDQGISRLVSRPVEDDPTQTARAYAFPRSIRRSAPTYQNEQPEPSENDHLMEPPASHDEDTQPSTWSPSTDSNGPTSFQNALALETLTISQPGEIPPSIDVQSNTSLASSTVSVNIPNNTSGNSTNANESMGHQCNINCVSINVNIS